MRRWSIRILIALLVLLVLVIGVTQVVLWTDIPQRIVLAQVQRQLGLRMTAASVQTGWLGETDLRDVTLSLPLADESFLRMPTLDVGHTWLPWILLTRKVDIKSLELNDATLFVRQDPAGRWNVQEVLELLARTAGKQQAAAAAPATGRPKQPKLPKIALDDGTIIVTDRHGRKAEVSPVSFTGQPDGPLVWRYELDAGAIGKMVGQLAPGTTWQHQVDFAIANAGPTLQPWLGQRVPTLAAAGEWNGQVQQGQLIGRLNLEQFKAADVTVSGIVNARAGGGVAVLSPRAMFVKTPYKLLPDLRLASGTLRLDGSVIRAERVEVSAMGGKALADGRWSMIDNAAELTAVWEEITLPGEIVHRGRIEASLRTPFPDQPVIKATLSSAGSWRDGEWDAVARLDGSGRSWRDIDWTFVAERLAWDGPPRPYELTDLTARLAMRGPLLTLTELRLPEAGRASGSGFINFAEQQWSLKLSGRGLTIPKLPEVPLDFAGEAGGDFHLYTLKELSIRGGELQASASGSYDRRIPMPLNLTVAVRPAPLAGDPETDLIGGDLRAQATLKGTAFRPRDLSVEGELHAEQLRLKNRMLGDVVIAFGGNITADKATLESQELDLLGGKWSFLATWLDRDPVVNDDNLRVRIKVRELPLSQVGEAFGRQGVEGVLDGAWTFNIPDMSRRRAFGSGTFQAQDIRIEAFRAESASGTVTLKDGRLIADPLELAHGDGTARGTASVALNALQRPTISIEAKNWPVELPESRTTLKIDAASQKLDLNLENNTVAGAVTAAADVTVDERALGRARVDAQISGQAISLRTFGMEGFGGRAEGSAQIDLAAPLDTTMNLTWRDIDAATVAALHPRLDGLAGRFGGSVRIAPAEDPRALEPLRVDLVLESYGGSFRGMEVGDATITAFVNYNRASAGADASAEKAPAAKTAAGPAARAEPAPWSRRFRVVLSDSQEDPSLIRLADGIVRIWGRVSPHRSGEVFPTIELTPDRLSLDQIVHAIDPDHDPLPGRISGTIRLFGNPREKERIFGTGHLELTDSDIANVPIFSRLYNAMRLDFTPKQPSGEGSCDLFLEASRLVISNFRYFNRGADARARIEIENIRMLGDSPISGSAVGSLRPFKNLDLPFMADVDEVLNVLQSNVTSVVLYGTVEDQKTRLVPFAELSGAMKSFLLGDVRDETRGGSGR